MSDARRVGVPAVTLLLFGALSLLTANPALALKDPTRPPAYRPVEEAAAVAAPEPRWTVSSILISPERRVAVINGQPVQVGDLFAGVKVLAIDPERVVLRQGKTHIVVEFSVGRFKALRGQEG